MSLTFYYSPQSNATRIHWALEELGVPHETVRVDLRAGDQRRPEFLALNPNGKVPTIVLDGTPMFESVAIQIALGERFGVEKGLWPRPGSSEHLQALTWLVWGQVTLAGAVFRYLQNTSDYWPKDQQNARVAEATREEIDGLLKILDGRLAERPYLAGERFTLADLDVASVLGWGLEFGKLDPTPYRHLQAWLGRCTGRPSFARAMAG